MARFLNSSQNKDPEAVNLIFNPRIGYIDFLTVRTIIVSILLFIYIFDIFTSTIGLVVLLGQVKNENEIFSS